MRTASHRSYRPYEWHWYNWSTPPGHGGNAVFAGHFDWTINGQPVTGVFYSLSDLVPGDVIEVKLEDGTDYKYSVVGNLAIVDGDPQIMDLMGSTPIDMVTLITCGGVWTPDPNDPLGGRYDHRQVVRAKLIGGGPAEENIGKPRQEDSQG
jgi:sortase (surface protein transpeptidase)